MEIVVGDKFLVKNERYPQALRFRLAPVVGDPVFGSADTLEGEIPFLSSVDGHLAFLNHLDANPTIIENLSLSILAKYRNAWVNETDDEILASVRNQLRTLLMVAGHFPAEVRDRQGLIAEIMVISYALDNIVDGNAEDGVPELGEFDYAGLMELWSTADEPPFDAAPTAIADIERIIEVCKTCVAELKKGLENEWKGFYLEMRDDATDSFAAHLLTFGLAKEKNAPRYSEETMSELRRDLSGVKAVGNRIAYLKNIRICPEVARDTLFKTVVNRAADIGLVMNAILGLPKDVRHGTVDSPVTSSVIHDGRPLQSAFNAAMQRIHALYNDYSLATGKLVQLWGQKEPNVVAYVDFMNWYLDGMLLGYHTMENYGIRDKTQIVTKSKHI